MIDWLTDWFIGKTHNAKSGKFVIVWFLSHVPWVGSKGFCRLKCHFSLVKKCTFHQKFCHKSQILPSENEALSAVYNCYCCYLILWSLAKTVRGFWLLLYSRRKQMTAEYRVSWTVKNFARNPEFRHFVQFRQKSIFSSRRPVFVISSVFRQKRNPLEPTHGSRTHYSENLPVSGVCCCCRSVGKRSASSTRKTSRVCSLSLSALLSESSLSRNSST